MFDNVCNLNLFILYMGKINSTYANDSVLCVLRVQCSVVRLNMHGKSANKYSFPLDSAFLRSTRKNCTPNGLYVWVSECE